MSMKIDGHRQAADAEQARRLESATPAQRGGRPAETRSAKDGDRVDVSPDMRLATAAMQAALDAPAIRPDVVERARKSLDNGTLGADADRLADRIVASLLSE
jgi:flagellar biosynthesis anti-sigma factor FlgM